MSPRPRAGILDIQPYVGGESKVAGQNRVVKLAANEGAFGMPPGAQAAWIAAAAEGFRYPDGAATELRRAIGACFGLDPARIVCGAGSDELIALLVMAYGGPGIEMLISEYAFSIYEIYGRVAGCRVVKARERDRTADVDAMLALVSPATRLVFLANPNNPTGTMLPLSEVERLRRGLPSEALLVLDSAYAEYVEDPAYDPGVRLVDAGDNTAMLRTFSKIFGLGGARIGWCYGPPTVIDVLNRVRSPFNVNLAAQAAAIAALAEPGWVEKGRQHNTKYRAWLIDALRKLGLPVGASHGNFVLPDFGSAARADAAFAALKARGVIVRPMGSYNLGQFLRITVGTEEECALVADALAAFVGERAEAAHA
jgi:histidinol-phosphate aminotransferase